MGTKYVGWDDACEMAAILFVISPWYVRWGGAGRSRKERAGGGGGRYGSGRNREKEGYSE